MNDTPSRERLIARWRKATAARQNPAGPIAAKHAKELGQFNERLDQLRALAETTSDRLRSSTYERLWRTMSEELGLIANELDRGQITSTELPDALRRWSELGLTYLDTKPDRTAVEKILDPQQSALPAQLADARGVDIPAQFLADGVVPAAGDDAEPREQTERSPGRGAERGDEPRMTLPNPPQEEPDALAAHSELMERIGGPLTRADRAEFDAERVEDADDVSGAARLRAQAEQMRSEADELARGAGLPSLFDKDEDADSDRYDTRDLEHSEAENVGASDEPAIENNTEAAPADTPERTAQRDDAAASFDTPACTVAVTRAAVSADMTSRRVDEDAQAAGRVDRDAQLAAWRHDDQAMKKNDAAVSDDAPSW